MQAEVNIGMFGHVDHGKTSLTRALTGKWTDTHSEEMKRGITIKIGYADASFYKCEKCGECGIAATCPSCKGHAKLTRRVSFLDAPGHETLMTTMIAAANIVDGALLVIAANEPCPQAQTAEHLMVLDTLGIKNVVVVQNKIDLVTDEKAEENYNQITAFLAGTSCQDAPIIPISANYNANIDALIESIEAKITTPKRNLAAPAKMYIARSFDINRPGSKIIGLVGGVAGGSLICGVIKPGDKVQIKPGIYKRVKDKETLVPLTLEVVSVMTVEGPLSEAKPGGLIGVGTKLDPALTKGDTLVGNILGNPDALGPAVDAVDLEYSLVKREGFDNQPLKMSEPLVISVGTATSIGVIMKLKSNTVLLKLKRPIYAEKGAVAALSRRVGTRWRLSAFAKVK